MGIRVLLEGYYYGFRSSQEFWFTVFVIVGGYYDITRCIIGRYYGIRKILGYY